MLENKFNIKSKRTDFITYVKGSTKKKALDSKIIK